MLKNLGLKVYNRIQRKNPNAIKAYALYKEYNMGFHAENRTKSWSYLRRLIRAEKANKKLALVALPKGARPFSLEPLKENTCTAIPDSMLVPRIEPEKLVESLKEYDVVSFDVFDTLIFRPFAKPIDLFYLLEYKFKCFNFQELRPYAEGMSRAKTTKPNYEVDIYDIYEELANYTPLKREDAEVEIELEKDVCYANPYMKKVYDLLKKNGKKVVVTSDMYLPPEVITAILAKNGYDELEKIYVSNEYGYNKASGKLFEFVIKDFGKNIIHIGDNYDADVRGAERAGIKAYHYAQCNELGNVFRPATLISPVSSVYKGIVNNYMYNGTNKMSAREDFGFIYAGPIASGFCEWLNEFCENKKLDKILFLARDMHIFHEVYNKHYKKFDNSYAAASRFSLQELIVDSYPAEFFHHTIKARCDRGYTIKKALNEINLDFLCDECKRFGLNPNDLIVANKIGKLEKMFISNRARIVEHFKDNEQAAKQYFKEKIGDAKRICLTDLGWRGSVLAYLRFLLVDKWHLCEEVKGVLLGTSVNTTSIALNSEGIVSSFAYNHLHNRDYLSGGGWETEYIRILSLESIFTSEEPSLIEYRLNPTTKETELLCYKENLNKEIIREYHTGIMKFVDKFESFRSKYRDAYPISAVDAFEAMQKICENYEYIARIIGDVVDTPFAIAGLNIDEFNYVPLGELMLERKMIQQWPIKGVVCKEEE